MKQSPALKDLTTSSMATFRQQYDQNPTCNNIPFFTLNGVGSEGNKAVFNGEGKAFLNAIDTQNDDLVIASYALKPNSTNIATLNAYHSQLNDGYIVWNVIEPYIKGTNTTGMITTSNYTVGLDQNVYRCSYQCCLISCFECSEYCVSTTHECSFKRIYECIHWTRCTKSC